MYDRAGDWQELVADKGAKYDLHEEINLADFSSLRNKSRLGLFFVKV